MDCLEAQAILSAAHDGEQVDPADLTAARDHCEDCADCTAFAEGMRSIDAAPVPVVPPAALDAVLSRIAELAAARAKADRATAEAARVADAASAQTASPETAEPEPAAEPALETSPSVAVAPAPPTRFSWFTDSVKWATIGAVAAAAVIGLVVLVVASTSRPPAATETAGTATTSGGADFTYAGAGKASTATAPAAPAPVRAAAPDYVAYANLVYAPGALLSDSSEATPQVGTVSTAFASGGAASAAPVYASPLADSSIVVKGPDGYRIYAPVVRMLASQRYQLEAGNALDRFGVWPTLPARFTPPTASDGSPTFAAAGQDALGVTIFAPSGQPTSAGFAVAPGTSSGDPAASNPNWTWWTPIAP